MSFEIREAAAHQVSLTSAILLYGASRQYSSSRYADFATMHPVQTNDSGAAVIGAGQPLDQRSLLALTMELSGHARIRHGLLSPDILSLGMNHVMWWVPPATRSVFFSTRGKDTVGERSGKTPHPGLIFLAQDRGLSIFAVKGKDRPVANTALYHAPYFNVWDTAKVCTGSTPLPEESIVGTMQAWQSGFFGSNFSHTNHAKVVRYEGGAHAFWTDMLDGTFKTFPTKVLVLRRKETVGKLIEQIEAGPRDE